MYKFSESLSELQKQLQLLPSIGEKSAQRLAYFLINQPKDKVLALAESIVTAINNCKPCSQCFLLSDTDPCKICTDPDRNEETLCVVESTRDIILIESTNEFKGRYFVLGNLLSPVSGIGPHQIRIPELEKYLQKNHITEVILAISPSTEGETTIHFIAEFLKEKDKKITRLSTGIPYGSDMEYTGAATLMNALRRRYPV
ncbi:MAG: recombination mediator RecR [Candidatus Cloacimonetes bacterium]|nr:recombination mediator RecR [Candidatus Cloacimonadota bacterium]